MGYVILLIVLLLIVLVFGVSSGMHSYADAQASQAAIEQARAMQQVAQVAQVNAWGQVITVLAVLAIVVVILALVVVGLYLAYLRNNPPKATRGAEPAGLPSMQTVNALVMMRIMQMLDRGQSQPTYYLESSKDESEDPLSWWKS